MAHGTLLAVLCACVGASWDSPEGEYLAGRVTVAGYHQGCP